MFSDEMDLLIMATENGDIYLWEFDDSISGPVPEDNSEVDENQQIMEVIHLFIFLVSVYVFKNHTSL